MTLQSSGAISAYDINIELGRSGSAQFSIGGSAERTLAGVASGQISFSDFYGKSNYIFSGTMTQSYATYYTYYGAVDSYSYGFSYALSGSSLTNNSFSGGKYIVEWFDNTGSGGTSAISISSGTNPGQSFFTTATRGSTSKSSASAASYSYDGYNAVWVWNSTFGFTSSGTVSVSLS